MKTMTRVKKAGRTKRHILNSENSTLKLGIIDLVSSGEIQGSVIRVNARLRNLNGVSLI